MGILSNKASRREDGKVRNVCLKSTWKMDVGAAIQKARRMRAEVPRLQAEDDLNL